MLKIVNQDRSKCTLFGFQEGVYRFRLNVTDDGGLWGSDDAYIILIRSKNEAPVAKAKDLTITLPASVAFLNGSESSDDAGIVRWLWTAHDDVPACITFLGNSKVESVAILTGLVPGTFLFDLAVWDHSDVMNATTVALTIFVGMPHLQSVEMYLKKQFGEFTYRVKNKFEERLSATLSSQIEEANDVVVVFSSIDEDFSTGRIRIVFQAERVNIAFPSKRSMAGISQQRSEKVTIIEAWEIVKILRSETTLMTGFSVDSIDALCNNRYRKRRRTRKAAVNTERRLNETKSNGYVKSNRDSSSYALLLAAESSSSESKTSKSSKKSNSSNRRFISNSAASFDFA
ncbi:serine-type protease inhibitor [Loa loa]|uniref:Serine-type protease inhibitor n=1 Tax=Loa loa TaxID=7209 RepID=A0A1S0UKN4_LOALO|nr:serine-type protease inhibitor [Loa loa]EJD75986.1 serine-type protease inhibitor [Loa loa]